MSYCTVPSGEAIKSFRNSLVGLAALVLVAALAGGCSQGGGTLQAVGDSRRLEQMISRSSQPVLVDYYKQNCPTCVLQDDVLEGLAGEYAGRVSFMKFKIREATMASTDPRFMDRQGLKWVPTTVLYVNGRETDRWTFNVGAGQIRPALNEAIQKTSRKAQARSPARAPARASVLAARPVAAPARLNQAQCGPRGCPINFAR